MRLPFWAKILAKYHRMRFEAAKSILKAARDFDPGARVYLIGSVVEGTSTIYSDIDVLVCLERRDLLRDRPVVKILSRAMDVYGLPIDYPVELHVMDMEKCQRLLEKVKHIEVTLAPKHWDTEDEIG